MSKENKNILSLDKLKKLKNIENIEYFDLIIKAKETYFVTIEKTENYLIGLISLSKTENEKWLIQSVDIAKNEQKKGNSKILIEEFLKFCSKEIKGRIEQSSYSKMGFMFLRKNFYVLAKKYPNVNFIDHNKIGFNNI